MARREYEGRTAAEAAIRACEELNISRSQLRYEVITDEGEGLNRRVVIGVDEEFLIPEEESLPPRRDEIESQREDAPTTKRMRGRNRPGRNSRGSRDGGRGRNNRDRGRNRDRGHRRRSERDYGEGFEQLLSLDPIPAELPPQRAALETAASEKAVTAQNVLKELLKLMEVEVEVFRVQDDAEEIHFDMRGNDAAKIIGKKGGRPFFLYSLY